MHSYSYTSKPLNIMKVKYLSVYMFTKHFYSPSNGDLIDLHHAIQ